MPSQSLKPESIPIDTTAPLSPTHAFHIQYIKSSISILDLSPHLATIFSSEEGPSFEKAQALTTPSAPPVYTLKKNNLLGTHVSVTSGEGKDIAEWRSPIISLKMGTTAIKILPSELNGEAENVEIKPVGIGRRAEVG